MAKDLLRLRRIYEKTDGRCHICHSKLSFISHGKDGMRGAWHIDHVKPGANGGSNHGNNLFAACIGCNLDKGT
jgi:5-methylcytosine-specific restriction endonuclease McrA